MNDHMCTQDVVYTYRNGLERRDKLTYVYGQLRPTMEFIMEGDDNLMKIKVIREYGFNLTIERNENS